MSKPLPPPLQAKADEDIAAMRGMVGQIQPVPTIPYPTDAVTLSNQKIDREAVTSFRDYAKAAWRQDVPLDGLVGWYAGSQMVDDNSYNVWADPRWEEVDKTIPVEYHPWLAEARSPAQFEYIRGRIQDKMDDLTKLGDLGVLGTAGRFVLGVADPTMLLSGYAGGLVYKGYQVQRLSRAAAAVKATTGAAQTRAGAALVGEVSRAPSITAGVVSAAAQNAAYEKVRQSVNFEDSTAQVVEAALFGAAISAPFIAGFSRRERRIAAAAQKEQEALHLLADAQEGKALTPEQQTFVVETLDSAGLLKRVEQGDLTPDEVINMDFDWMVKKGLVQPDESVTLSGAATKARVTTDAPQAPDARGLVVTEGDLVNVDAAAAPAGDKPLSTRGIEVVEGGAQEALPLGQRNISDITVYHGTDKEFDSFEGGMFTSNRDRASNYAGGSKGRVIEAKLDIKNPMPWERAFGLTPTQIKEAGFDGTVQWGDNGEVLRAVVVDPAQVRPATNKAPGGWDEVGGDTVTPYSLSDTAKGITDGSNPILQPTALKSFDPATGQFDPVEYLKQARASVGTGTRNYGPLLDRLIEHIEKLPAGERARFFIQMDANGLQRSHATDIHDPSNQSHAYYDPNTNTAHFGFLSNNVGVVVHETTHVLTSRLINKLGAEHPAVKNLQSVFDYIKDRPEFAGQYGLKDLHEMIAEAWASPDFGRKLAAIEIKEAGKRTTLFERFVDSVLEILGFSKGTPDYKGTRNLLEYTLLESDRAMVDYTKGAVTSADWSKRFGKYVYDAEEGMAVRLGFNPRSADNLKVFDPAGRWLRADEYGFDFNYPVHTKDGLRLDGFSDKKQTTFKGYDKNGERITIRASDVSPEDIVQSSGVRGEFATLVSRALEAKSFAPKSVGANQSGPVASVADQRTWADKKLARVNLNGKEYYLPTRLDIYATLNRSDNAAVRKLAYDLVKDPIQNDANYAQAMTASEWKSHYRRTLMGGFFTEARAARLEAAKIRGKRFMGRVDFTNEFNGLVTRITRGGPQAAELLAANADIAPMLQRASAAQKKMYADFLEEMKAAGVKGAEDLKPNDFYVNRIWDHNSIRAVGFDRAVDIVAASVKDPELRGDRKAAEKFVRTVMRLEYSPLLREIGAGVSDMAYVRSQLEKAGLTGKDIDETIGTLLKMDPRSDAGRAPQLKFRWDLDEGISVDGKSISDLTENDAFLLADAYAASISGHIGLAKVGIRSSEDWSTRMKEVLSRHEEAGGDPERLKRDRQLLEDIYASITGRPMSTHDFSPSARLAAVTRAYTRSTVLGMLGWTAAWEMKQAVALTSARAVFRHAPTLTKLLSSLAKGYIPEDKLARDIQAFTGFGNEIAMSYMRDMEVGDFGLEVGLTKLERLGNLASHTTDVISGNRNITSLTRNWTGKAVVQKHVDWAASGKIPEGDIQRMVGQGISREDLTTVLEHLREYAVVDGNGVVKELDYPRWKAEHPQTHDLYLTALQREIRDAIQDPDLGETMPWMHTTIGKIFGELKSFMMVAHAKNFLKNVSYGANDVRAWQVFMISYVGEMMSYALQQAISTGHDPQKLQEKLTPEKVALAAFGRASTMGITPFFVGSAGKLLTGEDPFTGLTANTGNRSFLPPSVSTIQNVMAVPGVAADALTGRGVTSGEARAVFKTLPLNNMAGMRNVTDMLSSMQPETIQD